MDFILERRKISDKGDPIVLSSLGGHPLTLKFKRKGTFSSVQLTYHLIIVNERHRSPYIDLAYNICMGMK